MSQSARALAAPPPFSLPLDHLTLKMASYVKEVATQTRGSAGELLEPSLDGFFDWLQSTDDLFQNSRRLDSEARNEILLDLMQRRLGSRAMGEHLETTPCASWPCLRNAAISCLHCGLIRYCRHSCWKDDTDGFHENVCSSIVQDMKSCPPLRRKHISSWLPYGPAAIAGVELPTISNPVVPVYGLLGDLHTYSPEPSDLSQAASPSAPAPAPPLPDHLKFFFPALYDLRNVFQTVCQIPDDYIGRVTLFINSASTDLAARDVLILELLRFYGSAGVDAAISLWYSIAFTASQDAIQQVAMRRMLRTIEVNGGQYAGYLQNFRLSKTGSSLQADFGTDVWSRFAHILSTDFSNLSLDFSNLEGSRYFRQEELDNYDKLKMNCCLPGHLASWRQYHSLGLLTPMKAFSLPFSAPNALRCGAIAAEQLPIICRYTNDVLCGWDIPQLIRTGTEKRHAASDLDLYGCLFFHLRDMMQTFLQRTEKCCIELRLTQVQRMKALAEDFQQAGIKFHRIDACALAHRESKVPANHVTLIETVQILGSLLLEDASPAWPSLLLTASLDWVDKYTVDDLQSLGLAMKGTMDIDQLEISERMAYSENPPGEHSARVIQHNLDETVMGSYFGDLTILFSRHLKSTGIDVVAEKIGLQRNVRHRIVAPRCCIPVNASPEKQRPADYSSSDEMFYFQLLFSGFTFLERFQEWGWLKGSTAAFQASSEKLAIDDREHRQLRPSDESSAAALQSSKELSAIELQQAGPESLAQSGAQSQSKEDRETIEDYEPLSREVEAQPSKQSNKTMMPKGAEQKVESVWSQGTDKSQQLQAAEEAQSIRAQPFVVVATYAGTESGQEDKLDSFSEGTDESQRIEAAKETQSSVQPVTVHATDAGTESRKEDTEPLISRDGAEEPQKLEAEEEETPQSNVQTVMGDAPVIDQPHRLRPDNENSVPVLSSSKEHSVAIKPPQGPAQSGAQTQANEDKETTEDAPPVKVFEAQPSEQSDQTRMQTGTQQDVMLSTLQMAQAQVELVAFHGTDELQKLNKAAGVAPQSSALPFMVDARTESSQENMKSLSHDGIDESQRLKPAEETRSSAQQSIAGPSGAKLSQEDYKESLSMVTEELQRLQDVPEPQSSTQPLMVDAADTGTESGQDQEKESHSHDGTDESQRLGAAEETQSSAQPTMVDAEEYADTKTRQEDESLSRTGMTHGSQILEAAEEAKSSAQPSLIDAAADAETESRQEDDNSLSHDGTAESQRLEAAEEATQSSSVQPSVVGAADAETETRTEDEESLSHDGTDESQKLDAAEEALPVEISTQPSMVAILVEGAGTEVSQEDQNSTCHEGTDESPKPEEEAQSNMQPITAVDKSDPCPLVKCLLTCCNNCKQM